MMTTEGRGAQWPRGGSPRPDRSLRDEVLVFMGEQRAMNAAAVATAEANRLTAAENNQRVLDAIESVRKLHGEHEARLSALEHWKTGTLAKLAGVAGTIAAVVSYGVLYLQHLASRVSSTFHT